jgi:hypothetical protein
MTTAALAQETERVMLMLLKIEYGPGAPVGEQFSPIYLVANTEAITSNGNVHSPFNFKTPMPVQSGGSLPGVRFRIDNVDRQIIQVLRPITTAPKVSVSVVMDNTPNTIEVGPIAFRLREWDADVQVLDGILVPADILREPFPLIRFVPSYFPGLF